MPKTDRRGFFVAVLAAPLAAAAALRYDAAAEAQFNKMLRMAVQQFAAEHDAILTRRLEDAGCLIYLQES